MLLLLGVGWVGGLCERVGLFFVVVVVVVVVVLFLKIVWMSLKNLFEDCLHDLF